MEFHLSNQQSEIDVFLDRYLLILNMFGAFMLLRLVQIILNTHDVTS